MEIEAEDLGNLNNSIGAKKAVDGKIEIDDRIYSVGVHYAGKSTLDAVKKSYQIIFKEATFRGSQELRIGAQFSDQSMIRGPIGFHWYAQAGLDVPFIEPVALYLNNRYLGLYHLIEPVDLDFFHKRSLDVDRLYKAKFGNAGFEAEFLTRLEEAYSFRLEDKDWAPLRLLWEEVNREQVNLALIEQLLDVEQYLTYIAVTVLLNHWDGYDNNYFLARHRQDKSFASILGIWIESMKTVRWMKGTFWVAIN